MDRDAQDLYRSARPTSGPYAVSELIHLAAEVISPAAQMLLFAWLEATRKNIRRSRHFLKMAEHECKDETERCYVLHIGALVLFSMGDTQMAIKKDRMCLELCSRLSYGGLRAEVLSHLSALFGALGHRDLEAAFAREARAGAPEWLHPVATEGNRDKGGPT